MPLHKGNPHLELRKSIMKFDIKYHNFPLAGGGTRNLFEPTFGTVSLQSSSSDLSSQSVVPSHLWAISTQFPSSQVNWSSVQKEKERTAVYVLPDEHFYIYGNGC